MKLSPIEAELLMALVESGWTAEVYRLGAWEMVPQCTVVVGEKTYRLDFAFFGPDDARIAVETDGHGWHHTPEQMGRDRARDRALTLAGWKILRFTGTEVHRTPAACVADIARATGLLALPSRCLVPPTGWTCSREPGHDGPCAASPACTFAERLAEARARAAAVVAVGTADAELQEKPDA